ncbi:DNA mismatch repair protein MutS [Alicyclobacillus vulcanalis]|uniref:DNA mismatch repair protein MutS n=1 Tax=Alicyclobacillus vulcanalis TaxID=252246 RepID=A0A1N7MT12_9BACL|nr:DNA mismatch repair protein MutS [Alicyclobacillus vulcanalis]SIS89284.1 DNA mismatch repair protein MutS [Alicyclobacillus vulcanalis]
MSLTPMMRQYREMKSKLNDTLLMFRLGDFYELFFEDAVTASQVLDITLTGRDAGEAGRVPMCGVPHHALDGYLERLVEQGYRVAICDQVEDPKTAKGLVRREIVRIVTPGTALTEATDARYLAALAHEGDEWGLALLDMGAGDVWVGGGRADEVRDHLARFRPREVLLVAEEEAPAWLEESVKRHGGIVTRVPSPPPDALVAHYGVPHPEALGLAAGSAAVSAANMVFQYLKDTQMADLRHLSRPRPLLESGRMWLSERTIEHLELVPAGSGKDRRTSLYDVIRETVTAAGSRLLRTWMVRPLVDRAAIEERLDAVTALSDDFLLRAEIRETLRGMHDLSRLLAKCSIRRATPRDLLALAHAIEKGHGALDLLPPDAPPLLARLVQDVPDFRPLASSLANELVEDPPATASEGGIFRDGIDPEIDRLRALQTDGRQWLRAFEARERERTGIKSLKIGYNKVFGYYIEVSKANLSLVPEDYERKQTLASGERFTHPELKAREADILTAAERVVEMERERFDAWVERIRERASDLQRFAEVVSTLDVLASLAELAVKRGYVRPEVTDEIGIEIREGRHPVVEASIGSEFVPNDLVLTPEEPIVLLTGPNMGGKSTYMRQAALIAILAQMGSFVPARYARMGLVDRVFTRIGASDDLSRGQSTFMVEMTELAEILREASGRSLVLLDEIGRGTSTYDGLSIAEAVLEDLAKRRSKPLTLFATHYHELISFSEQFACVRNQSMAVEETEDGIRFLHSVVMRPSDRSYGIQVARLAGLPDRVIRRAMEFLAARETLPEVASARRDAPQDARHPARARDEGAVALDLFTAPYRDLAEWLAAIDVMRVTPLEAMQLLHEAAEKARDLVAWAKSR